MKDEFMSLVAALEGELKKSTSRYYAATQHPYPNAEARVMRTVKAFLDAAKAVNSALENLERLQTSN